MAAPEWIGGRFGFGGFIMWSGSFFRGRALNTKISPIPNPWHLNPYIITFPVFAFGTAFERSNARQFAAFEPFEESAARGR